MEGCIVIWVLTLWDMAIGLGIVMEKNAVKQDIYFYSEKQYVIIMM